MKLRAQPTTPTTTNGNTDLSIVVITPAVAELFLGRNTHNRPVRQRTVDAYAIDMVNGDWQWNGEGIKFDVNDVLLDGQHRLLAIVQSGVTVAMPVFSGLAPETQDTMDGGIKRKFSDVLRLRGETAAVSLASITRAVNRWEAGYRRGLTGGAVTTNAQLSHTLELHPELRQVAQASDRDATKCALPASVLGLCRWLFEQIDSVDAEFFFDRLTDPYEGLKGAPIFELRRTLDDSKKSVRGERNTTYLLAVTIKAWNKFREHGNEAGTVGLYRFRAGGANPESFPEPA